MKHYYIYGACSLAAHIVVRDCGFEFDFVKTDLTVYKTDAGVREVPIAKDLAAVAPEGAVA